MLCVNIKEYVRPCMPSTGGISNILVFDPDDLDFTQAAPVDGVAQPYTAVDLRDGATLVDGGGAFRITFLREEAEWAWTQSVKGCSVKYEHTFTFQLPDNSHNLTTFLQALDAASCCCGLGLVIRMADGRIFIAGEKYVNGSEAPRFSIVNSGSTGTSGKLYDDFNGGTIVLTGPFSRNLYEFTGDWADIEAMVYVPAPPGP